MVSTAAKIATSANDVPPAPTPGPSLSAGLAAGPGTTQLAGVLTVLELAPPFRWKLTLAAPQLTETMLHTPEANASFELTDTPWDWKKSLRLPPRGALFGAMPIAQPSPAGSPWVRNVCGTRAEGLTHSEAVRALASTTESTVPLVSETALALPVPGNGPATP